MGENTLVAGGAALLSHDHCKRVGNNMPCFTDTRVEKNCCIAVAGNLVTKNVPSRCVVAGNPAKIVRTGLRMNDFAAPDNWSEGKDWT